MCEWQVTEFGKVPGHWKIETIEASSNKVTDGSHFSPKPCSVGKYMCSVKDMTYNRFDFSNCKLISQNDFDKLVVQGCKPEKNDILISKDGANCLDLIFVFDQEEDLVLLSSIAIVRLLPNIDSNFVCYFLLSPACQYIMRNNFVSGSAIPRVVLKDFKKISILLPPLPEQRAIASVLSSLDDKIDLLHRQNTTLEAMAETLFRQWFVEEAEEGWGEGTLGDVASFHNGKKRPDNIIEGNIPIYGGNGILGYANKSNYEGVTVIIGRVGAYCGSLYIERNPVWISDNALVAKPINKGHPSFLLFLLKSLQLNEMAEGSSHPLLTQTLLKSTQIILPPERLIESFVYQAGTWLNKTDKNNKQIHTLEKLRDMLLPKLMSGEVRLEYNKEESK